MEPISQSSKVTVEYHDPSGIFSLVSRDIASRLPLRNLNWQSPPRPLRQIKSLHVDFAPDTPTQSTLNLPASSIDADGHSSLDIVRRGADPHKTAVKERRHQIPGFRTSPYLKIYVLRCDDKESYKDADRRKIREWIRDNAQPDGKREDHDAFEWMILHVVIPDTIAASEPRWRESAKDPDELKERKGGNKLIGQGTRTVFDRLRADFNESSKSGLDRVAQIRPPKGSVPADLLPTPALAQTLEESSQERENAWNDVISKFKTLILEPFDRRVRQYEADITEQESRRSLPGWNFCTFFIHKEGLAKALESIGLVEDSLAIYDELSVGLETVLREIAAGQANGTATSFAPYTNDLRDRISGLPEKRTNETHEEMTDAECDAAALFSKDYRDRIVRSDISLFDFFCYIFSRQKALILRLANARSVRLQLGADASREGGEDLVLTSEVCWRASNFIHNTARTLRQDLMNRPSSEDPDHVEVVNESIVSSWIWATTGQVLEETAVPALLDVAQLNQQGSAHLPNGKPERPPMSIGLGANTHPQRTTSLPGHKISVPELQRPASRPRTQDDTLRPSSSRIDNPNAIGLPGQAELATYRAELIQMRRKMLEVLARRRGWYAGWAFAKSTKANNMESVKLDDAATDSARPGDAQSLSKHQILSPALKRALSSESEFQATFEQLTDAALRYYFTATQSKSAESLVADLALLKCQQGEHETALSYFQHALPLFSTDSWNIMEMLALRAYADCLKQLQMLEDYVQNGLALLGKVACREMEHKLPYIRPGGMATLGKDDGDLDISGMFSELAAASADLKEAIVQPVKSFFSEVHLHREVLHESESDAFSLAFQLRHVLEDEVDFDEVVACLVNYNDPTQEVVLQSLGPVTLKPGLNKMKLRSRAVAYGPYLIDRIILSAKKIRFIEELRPPRQPTPLGFTEIEPPTVTVIEPEKPPAFVFLYAPEHAFSAELRRSRKIRIDKPRHLEVRLRSGQNEIDKIEVRMKPTSAGLRVHLADATPTGIKLGENEELKPGHLVLGALSRDEAAVVSIPYTVEQANRDIAVRLEIRYLTKTEEFVFLQSAKMSNELLLDVDVNDVFQLDTLYSSFTVRTTTQTPFTVLEARLGDSPIYAIEGPPALPLPLNVYKSQPMNLVYKVTRKPNPGSNILKRDAALALGVLYQPTDELILGCLQRAFAADLRVSDFKGLHRLLVPLLIERSTQAIKTMDLEMAILLGEARVPGFEAIGWEEVVATLSEQLHAPLVAWLRQWHSTNPFIPVAGQGTDDMASQHITICVDVPNIDMVFGVSLDVLGEKSSEKADPPRLVLGQPVAANIKIRHTSHWSAKSVFPNVPTFKIQGEGNAPSSFVCDVSADPDMWIIGGQRRSHFTPQDGIENESNVVLVPLKLGVLPLPAVDVLRESLDAGTSADNADGPSISSESHCESAGQLVHVVRDLRTSKIQIVESPAAATLSSSRPGTASTTAVGW